jgi:very-short-patch-repair endonuclease
MAHFSVYSTAGRAILRGGYKRGRQGLLGPRPLRAAPAPIVAQPIIVDGKKLNRWEATVWFALERRGEDWRPQVRLFNSLGVGVADFLSVSRKQVIEVDGPFHDTQGGKALDFHREAVRRQAGYRTIRIKQNDLPRIDANLSVKLWGMG